MKPDLPHEAKSTNNKLKPLPDYQFRSNLGIFPRCSAFPQCRSAERFMYPASIRFIGLICVQCFSEAYSFSNR